MNDDGSNLLPGNDHITSWRLKMELKRKYIVYTTNYKEYVSMQNY